MAALNAAPLLAALLRRALPGLAVLDAAVPAEGGLYPFLPEARCGVAPPDALPAAERDLLARFRQAGGAAALFGFDPAADAALAAGAPEAWDGAADRLVALGEAAAAQAGAWLGSGAMVLARAAPAALPGAERIMLLLGMPAPVERLDLLLPEGRSAAILPALAAAARALAEAGGAGWQHGARTISPRLATLTLLAGTPFAEAVTLPAGRLILDAEGGALLRLLLGCLPPRPWTLRILLSAGAPVPALFLDGARHEARATTDAEGRAVLEARITPAGSAPTVLGLAPAPALPLAVEIGP